MTLDSVVLDALVSAPPRRRGPSGDPAGDSTPRRRRRVTMNATLELIGSAVSAFLVVLLTFAVAGVSAPFGFLVAWYLLFLFIYTVVGTVLHGPIAAKDRLATVAVWSGAAIAFVPLVAVIGFTFVKGLPVAFADFPSFFVKDMSQYSATTPVTAVGVGPAIVGTVEQVGIASIATVPLGVMAATYLVDARGVFANAVAYVVDAMTGMPAIIAGLFVYLLWVVPHTHTGKSGFAAGLALAVMMLPIVTRTAYEVIVIVPGSLREAALALGAPQWRVILRVVLPTARAGLVTAVILGIARIAGETAPVLFVAGGNNHYNWNPFSGQQDNLPFRMYQMIFQSGPNAHAVAWGAATVLVLVVLTLFGLARLVGSGSMKRIAPWVRGIQRQRQIEAALKPSPTRSARL